MEKVLKKNNILKGAGVLLIAAVMILSTVSVTANTDEMQKVVKPYIKTDIKTAGSNNNPTIGKGVFSDSFEYYEDFIVDDFPPWTTYDGDGGQTWGMEGVEWPNAYYTGSFMIFNPSQTTPPIDDNHPAHTGEKYASCWNAVTASAPNDDWLFTPQLALTEAGTVSFWGRSLTDQYGLEEIEVGVSTTDTDPSSFTIVSGPVINVPTDWTEYTYDLSGYTGEDVYIGIHVVSNDHFAFFLDDFSVTGVAMSEPDLDCDGDLTWTDVEPNATVNDEFTVSNVGESGSLLSWEIESYPDWGEWTFTPSSGSGLTPEDDPVTVSVSVVAPDEEETEFTGEVKVVNSDDPDDFCIIDVSLATPVNQEPTGLFDWVFLRGLVFNPREDGSRINARAINLHYIEITPQGLRRGVVRLKTVSFRNGVFIKMSEKGLLGNAVRVSGFCHGGIDIK